MFGIRGGRVFHFHRVPRRRPVPERRLALPMTRSPGNPLVVPLLERSALEQTCNPGLSVPARSVHASSGACRPSVRPADCRHGSANRPRLATPQVQRSCSGLTAQSCSVRPGVRVPCNQRTRPEEARSSPSEEVTRRPARKDSPSYGTFPTLYPFHRTPYERLGERDLSPVY